MTVLNRDSLSGFGFIARQIKGRFTAPQPGNPHVASGLRACLAQSYSPHRSLTVSTSERGVRLDLLTCIAQAYLRTAQFLSAPLDGVSLRWFR